MQASARAPDPAPVRARGGRPGIRRRRRAVVGHSLRAAARGGARAGDALAAAAHTRGCWPAGGRVQRAASARRRGWCARCSYPQPPTCARCGRRWQHAGLRLQLRHGPLDDLQRPPAAAADRPLACRCSRLRSGGMPGAASAARRGCRRRSPALVQDVGGSRHHDSRCSRWSPAPTRRRRPPPCSGAGATPAATCPSQLGSAGGYGHGALIAGGYDGAGERDRVGRVLGLPARPTSPPTSRCFGTSVPVSDVVWSAAAPVPRPAPPRSSSTSRRRSRPRPASMRLHVYIATAGRHDGGGRERDRGRCAGQPACGSSSTAGACASPRWRRRPRPQPTRRCSWPRSPASPCWPHRATAGALRLRRLPPAGRGRSGRAAVRHRRRRHGPAPEHVRQPRTRSCGTTSPAPAAAVCRGSGRGRLAGGRGRHEPVLERPSRSCRTSPCTLSPPGTAIPSTARPPPAAYAGWTTLGGTSASAPLLAGIVADINSYSLAHGGQRLGFAEPVPVRPAAPPTPPRSATSPSADNNPDGAGPLPGHAGLRPGHRHRRAAGRCAGRRPGRATRPLSPRSQPPGSDGAAVRCPRWLRYGAPHHPARRLSDGRGRYRRGTSYRPGQPSARRSRVAAHHRRRRRLVVCGCGRRRAGCTWRAVYLGSETLRPGARRPRHDLRDPAALGRARRTGPLSGRRAVLVRGSHAARAGRSPRGSHRSASPAAAGIASARPGWGRAAASGG